MTARKARLLPLCISAAAWLLGPAAGRADEPPVQATPEEWQVALAAVRRVTMDAGQSPERRANAIMAYAKLQSLRSQHADAIQTCWEVLEAPGSPQLAEAAVRAAGLVSRQRHGHLGGPTALLNDWQKKAPGGPAGGARGKVRMDLTKMRQYLMDLAGKKPSPMPLRAGMPGWAVVRPKSGPAVLSFAIAKVAAPGWMAVRKDVGPAALEVALPKIPPSPLLARDGKTGIPAALRVTFPVYTAPDWYKRVAFPLLKEPPKK